MAYYAQHGEDYFIAAMFAQQQTGTFMEVGCIDGKLFSNTLALEERGWRGICVEAHSDYIPMIQRNRPGSQVYHAAAAEQDKDLTTFYAASRGSLSTLDKTKEVEWRAHYAQYFSGFQEQQVPQRTLSRIFDDCGVGTIDVLSLDIEGYELQALSGLRFERHRPRLVVVESDTPEEKKMLDELLAPAGYHPGFMVANNCFYATEPELFAAITPGRHSIEVRHTRHPLDAGNGARMWFDYDVSLIDPVRGHWHLRVVMVNALRQAA